MPRPGRKSPSRRSLRASKAQPPSAGNAGRRAGLERGAGRDRRRAGLDRPAGSDRPAGQPASKPSTSSAAEGVAPSAVSVTPGQVLWLELMAFYIREAWLLDERKLTEWLELFTDDVLYFMPRRKNVLRREAHRE